LFLDTSIPFWCRKTFLEAKESLQRNQTKYLQYSHLHVKHCVLRNRIVRKMPEKLLPHTHSNPPIRIMAVRDGETTPLFDSALHGPPSPSPSLVIERHEVRPSDWHSVIIPEQVLTLHLRRCALEYEIDFRDCHYIARAKGSVVIEKRACEQRFRWSSSAPTLAVQLFSTTLEQAAEAAPIASCLTPTDCAAKDMRLSSLLFALERERRQGYPSGRLFVDGIEQALAAILVRYAGVAQRTPQVYKGGLAPYRMKRVTEFIHAHIEDEITLNELARDVD
jgi:AraC family transcriptional regulator